MKLKQLVTSIENTQLKTNLPKLQVGDLVKIGLISIESNKQRIQPYVATIIAIRKSGIRTTITVRRIFQNIGVETGFSIHSPLIKYISILRKYKVKKAKLYYLKNNTGKQTKLKERLN